MSLLPTGDKGQRYEISATGYPMEGTTVCGWSEDKPGAEKMAAAFRRAPGCTSTTIRDRWGKELDFTQYAGALR